MWVVGDAVDETASWPANDVPYVVRGNIELRRSTPLDSVPVLTIESGSELRFASAARLRVGDGNDGVLDARGTSTEPITFTTEDTASPAFWRGLDFGQGSDGLDARLGGGVVRGSGAGTGNVNFRSGSVVVIGAVAFTPLRGVRGRHLLGLCSDVHRSVDRPGLHVQRSAIDSGRRGPRVRLRA